MIYVIKRKLFAGIVNPPHRDSERPDIVGWQLTLKATWRVRIAGLGFQEFINVLSAVSSAEPAGDPGAGEDIASESDGSEHGRKWALH